MTSTPARAVGALILATLAGTAFAQAPDTGTWLVRARALHLDPANRDSTGLAFGSGVDVPLGDGLLLNVDVKKVQIRTDVSSFGAHVGEFRVDPLLFSVDAGWRF